MHGDTPEFRAHLLSRRCCFFFWKMHGESAGGRHGAADDQQTKARYLDFTQRAFAALRDAKVPILFIDIHANGGGNDDMWVDGILRYIVDKPYRWASGYRKKVIQGRESETEKVGDVIAGVVDKCL